MVQPPLNPHVRIVDEQGRPTPEFIRWWQSNRDATGNATLDTALKVSAALDKIGGAQGAILYRDSSNWNVLAPGIAGRVLQTGGAGANPSWAVAGGGTFLSLSDTPANYTGQANKAVTVKADESGLEFTTAGIGGGVADKAGFAKVTDATSWASVRGTNPRASGNWSMTENNTYGYLGWEQIGADSNLVMLESPTKKPTAGANFDFVFRIDIMFAEDFPRATGIFVENSGTGSWLGFGPFSSGGRFYWRRYNATTFVSETQVNGNLLYNTWFRGYLRVRRVGDTLSFLTSINGIGWVKHVDISLAAQILDVNRIGIFQRGTIVGGATLLWGLNDNGPQPPG